MLLRDEWRSAHSRPSTELRRLVGATLVIAQNQTNTQNDNGEQNNSDENIVRASLVDAQNDNGEITDNKRATVEIGRAHV